MIFSIISFCLSFVLIVFPITANQQTASRSCAGIYKDIQLEKSGGSASVTVYPDTDNSILFYIKIQYGGPSYKSGSLFGRVKIDNGIAIFSNNDYDCRFNMTFTNNSLIIRTLKDKNDCGFGYGVIADGTYKRISNKIVEYYIDEDGKRVYFNELTHED